MSTIRLLHHSAPVQRSSLLCNFLIVFGRPVGDLLQGLFAQGLLAGFANDKRCYAEGSQVRVLPLDRSLKAKTVQKQ